MRITWTAALCLIVGCSSPGGMTPPVDGAAGHDLASNGSLDLSTRGSLDGGNSNPDIGMPSSFAIKKVFVIALENQGSAAVYANSDAPYINGLMMQGGSATMYGDVLAAAVPSEPHYVWLEAGTNVFSDCTFSTDNDVSPANSTASTQHLVTQMAALPTPKTWRAYQEGLNSSTGACPIASNGQYAAKHDPFVFFQDVSGSPPSKTTSGCSAHHKAFTVGGLQADLAANDVADYTFITPDLCNNMHGGICTNGCLGSFTLSACVSAGDTWLSQIVPSILTYIQANDGVLLIVWDEPETSGTQPFVIIGPHVKANYSSPLAFSHDSYLKSLQEIMGVPVFSNVSAANDFSDFYEAGFFP